MADGHLVVWGGRLTVMGVMTDGSFHGVLALAVTLMRFLGRPRWPLARDFVPPCDWSGRWVTVHIG